MEHDKMERRSKNQSMENHKCEGSMALTAWKIVGGAVLALAATAVIVTLPDLKRYIKISTM